jgi:hypothetical protein
LLDVCLGVQRQQLFSGLTAYHEQFLPPGKLKLILETAGSLGAIFDTKLGTLPGDVERRYSMKMNALPEQEVPAQRLARTQDPMATYAFISQGFNLANRIGISHVMVHADSPSTVAEINRARGDISVLWILSNRGEVVDSECGDPVFISKNPDLGKDDQIRLALFSALLQNQVGLGERILTLSGPDESPHITKISSVVPGEEFSWLNTESLNALRQFAHTPVLERVIHLALRFSKEGIEGKQLGAIFVIASPESVENHLKQTKLNPLFGHPEESRSVLSKSFTESLRALASIDGAVIIRPDGIVESAFMYIEAPTEKIQAREGWGARHVSAASLTSVTDALAVVVSENGTVTIMWDGKPVLELSPA